MNDVRKHVAIVGRLHIVLNLISIGLAIFFWMNYDSLFLPTALVLFSIPGLIAGYGLIKKHSWARPFAIVMAALNLVTFPLGTIIGVYSFWVLFTDDARRLFVSGEPLQTA